MSGVPTNAGADSSNRLLDFTARGLLQGEQLARLDAVAVSNQSAFNTMIAALGRGRDRNIDWWVSRPATRNTHASSLYRKCMQLALVRALHEENAQIRVRVDDAAMADTISAAGIPVLRVRPRLSQVLRGTLSALREIASTLFHILMGAWAAHTTRSQSTIPYSGELIVVDEFVNRDSFANGAYVDHYFPGLVSGALTEAEAKRVCIVPTFYRMRRYRQIFQEMRRSTRRFIIREDYLRLTDYAFAFGYWWRSKRLKGRSMWFAGFDISRLIDADLSEGRFAYSVIQALLCYRFWTNIARYNLKISHLLDWYEGQDLDHAVAAAINWHALPVNHVGYRPVAPPHYLSVTPTQSEIDAGVVPRVFAVVGEHVRRELSQTLHRIEIRPAPSFRYQQLKSFASVREQRPSTVLVLLPLDIVAARLIGDLLRPMISSEVGRTWLIKYHPLMPRSEAEAAFGVTANNIRIVSGDYYHWLARCDLVVGGATNALSEAVAVGLPAICLASGNQPTEIPVPEWAPRRLWRVSYEPKELRQFLEELLQTDRGTDGIKTFRDELAGPWNLDAIRVSLGLVKTNTTFRMA